MKNPILITGLLLVIWSCTKTEVGPVDTRFENHMLSGYDVTSIAFDGLGNAWFGIFNWQSGENQNLPALIKYNISTGEKVVYDGSNSPVEKGMTIWTIVADSNNNIWIGCDGLIRFDGQDFTKYDSENSDIPVNFVQSIAVDSGDNIWFTSSTHMKGGFVRYDGKEMKVFTPENSNLPRNGVSCIVIDPNDVVWMAQYGAIDQTSLLRISGNTWISFDEEDFGFTLPFWSSIALNSKNQLCGGIDYTLSNSDYDPRPQLMIFDGENFKQIAFDERSNVIGITVDRDDNIWCRTRDKIAVYDGSNWTIDSLTFKNMNINKIAVTKDNKVWVGTSNGVFIN